MIYVYFGYVFPNLKSLSWEQALKYKEQIHSCHNTPWKKLVSEF